ncbi:MAG: kynureninase [Hyphomicrobiales bacterium]|nr:kynureninase [Hyphomicrobiales bacterium]
MTDFARTKALFAIPDGVVYLDGNSLGPPLRGVAARLSRVVEEEWGGDLIRAWNTRGWMAMPAASGDRIARLIGAPAGSVTMGDTLSIKVFQALAAALAMRPDRRVILSDTGNFPTDLYMAQGLIGLKDAGYRLVTVAPENVEAALDDTVAAMMLTEVDYRTGRLHDMARLTRAAHRAGAVAIWDLAHSAGALPVGIAEHDAEFAVGCTYKYLNGGPGAPAFIYVRPDLAAAARPALSGWIGHAAPFAFEPGYRPAPGVERMRVGTPPILALAALDAALDAFDGVDMADVRRRSIELSGAFVAAVARAAPGLELASPRDPAARGSQVSFRHPQAYAVMQALIERGVIGDVRAPDVLRFGFAPLYLDLDDAERGAAILGEILASGAWREPRFSVRAAVT